MIIKTTTEVYLDFNATTPVLPAAVKEAHDAMQEVYGNPSSTHTSGLRAKNILESARDLVREVLGADDGQIIFTSGATEAIQLAIFSTLCQIRQQRSTHPSDTKRLLLYSATEHKAVPLALKHWNQLLGVENEVVPIPVDRKGRLDLDFLSQHAVQADMICTMAVNNETGVITDLAAVESAIRKYNPDVRWMVDAVQAVGKIDLQLGRTTIDYVPVSGHKIYAPKGIGLLYARSNAPIVPLFAGGGQEHGARGGTENLPGVAAIAAVLQQLADSPGKTFVLEAQLIEFRQRLIARLKETFPTIVFNAPHENSVPTTINFAVKGLTSKELLDLFDAAGIRVSSGSACGSATVGSYVLDAMGLPRWQSDGAIRMSFGPLSTSQEIDLACRQIELAGDALCESCIVLSPNPAEYRQPLDGMVQLKNGSMCSWLMMDAASKQCVVIDPFAELAERIEALVRCQDSRVVAILDTHAHVDHESCRTLLLDHLKHLSLPSAQTDDLLGWPTVPDGELRLSDGSLAPFIRLGRELVIAQIDLPGHTTIGRALLVGPISYDGSQACLRQEDVKFALTGDTLLIGGIGRTDFECSQPEALYESLNRLPKVVSRDTLICPTHDYTNDFVTTLGCEISDQEFLRQLLDEQNPMTKDDFLQRKPGIDAGIAEGAEGELVCGLIRRCAGAYQPVELKPHELRGFVSQHPETMLIDVREPHEFVFATDWHSMGFESTPHNIPLTRLAGELPKLRQWAAERERYLIFLCRSGKRSGKAAEIARRLGLIGARHVFGGLAISGQSHEKSECLDAGFVI